MSVFFDTSVLIPVFLEAHEHHTASHAAFLKAERKTAFCAAHGLAEFYATLTRLPGVHRLSGEQVILLAEDVRERLTIVSLTGEEYFTALKEAANNGVVGGMLYDLLAARCALKCGASSILTWNVRHFSRLGPDVSKRVRQPTA